MTVVTDLTGETSDSDTNTNEKSILTKFNTVTPSKNRVGNVQTTIENAIMRGYSSGVLQSRTPIVRNDWDSHNQFCDSTFIYHANNSFAAPAYDTTTIDPTIPIRESHAIKLPLNSGDNKDKESASDVLSKGSCNTNDVFIPNTKLSPCLKNDDNHLMNAYLSRNETIGDIKELLFTNEFKILYDFSLCTNGLLPEVVASMDAEFGDISYVVKFYARTRPQYNAIYDKLCTIDRDKLPVCCVQTRRHDNVENDDFSLCGDQTEVIGTAVLNQEFYEMLLISCKMIDESDDQNNESSTVSSIENSLSIETKSIISVQSDNEKEVTSIINVNQQICLDCDMDSFKKIIMGAVYPNFYEEFKISNKQNIEVEKHFLEENWLTDELTQELQLFRPNVIVHPAKTDEFESMCKHLFPSGRKFANYRQLDQYVTVFLESWKCVKHIDGNSFRCFYAKPYVKKKITTNLLNPKKTVSNAITERRSRIDCPFLVRFSCPGIKDKSVHPIFRQVNITKCNPKHSCGLSTSSYRAASRLSKSQSKFDYKALNSVVNVMKIDPHLPARHLRSLLVGCLPPETDISSDYISNFRKRCQLYHASHPDALELACEHASGLISESCVNNKELSVLNDNTVCTNFRTVYANIMQSGSHTWKALAYLNKLKKEGNGFDFRIHLDEEDTPDGLVWMTVNMKRMLLQYGDILFLDTQKRQYNKMR